MTRRTALSTFASLAFVPTATIGQSKPLMDRVVARVKELLANQPATLKLLLPNGSGGNVNPVIAAFTKMTGVTVQTSETPVDSINTEIMLDTLSESQTYDVALPASFGLPDLAETGAIRPITDFAAQGP